jgi:hypothetical protein
MEPKDGDGLEHIILDDDQVSSVLCGYWAHSRVPLIMIHNEIEGLVIDTMFKVIRLYNTAVLVAVSRNVGIPLSGNQNINGVHPGGGTERGLPGIEASMIRRIFARI